MKKTITILLLLPLFFNMFYFVPSAQAAGSSDFSITAERLEQLLDPMMDEETSKGYIHGTAVVVTQGERILFSKGYGYADVDNKRSVDPAQTIMRVGSITKTVTATAAMQLVEQGKLTLHDDLNRFLVGYNVPVFGKKPITLHHLLTHTAGLDEAVYEITSLSRSNHLSAEQFLSKYFRDHPPVREPGEQYAYSNAGLGLVGNLIEQNSGADLNTYMSKHLFTPLDMPSANLTVPENNPNMAKSYNYTSGHYEEVPYTFLSIPGAGGLSATPNEFAHFMIAQLNGGQYQGTSILEPSTIETMHEQQFAEHPDLPGMGYGFYRGRLAGGIETLSHTGDVEGFNARMLLIPAKRIGVLVVSNAVIEGSTQMNQKIEDAITGLIAGPEKMGKALSYSREQLQQYERTYSFSGAPKRGWGKWLYFLGGKDFEVKAAEGRLILTGVFPDGSGERKELSYVPIAEGLFQEEGGGGKLWFEQGDHGWQMTLAQETTLAEQPGFLHRPVFLLGIYAGSGLLLIALLAIWLVRYVVRLFRRTKKPISLHITAITLLMSIFLVVQLVYGNTEITYGYPGWFAWGISSLPLAAVMIAVHLLWRDGIRSGKKTSAALGRCAFAAGCIAYTAFLFYWNMLSIHAW
ncbi:MULTISPECIES: serine hydrolase domain-containing protein [Paenibacillus]|uniref:serine hydrolase domain-containing protein n=1 Tax=Paenibacillus TaxID=44249 RepID=UPI002FDF364B